MQSLNLNLTDSARAAIDSFMAGLDYDESIPCLTRNRFPAHEGRGASDYWTVCAYHPDRVRFFEQLCRNSGAEFFFRCDGLVFLLWQPAVAGMLQNKTLDYSLRRYHLR
jgi:hypothetical protein